MMRYRQFAAVFVMAVVLLAGDALAEEKKPEKAAGNPHMKEMQEQARALSEELSPTEVERLVLVRHGFGIVSSTYLVKEHVGKAVEACAEANPPMAEAIRARHQEWLEQIEAPLETNEAKLEKVMAKPYFDTPEKVESYLQTIHKAAEFANERLDREPLTDKKSCRDLQKSMDETAQKLGQLLSEIQWPAKPHKTQPQKTGDGKE